MPAHARHWRRRWPRGTAFAVALLLGFLLFSPPVAADSVPATTYWRVIATIAAATDGDPAALTQAADALAQIDAVALADGTVIPVDHSFLLDELRAEPVDAARVQALAQALLAAQRAQAAPTFTQGDTAALAAILARPEFGYVTPAPPRVIQWLGRQWQRVMRALGRFLPDWTLDIPVGVARAIAVIGVAVLAAAVALTLMRIAGELTADSALAGEDDVFGTPLTADAALRRAQEYSAGGDYRTAVRYLYLSTLLLLEQHGVLRYDRALTNREVLRRVAHDPTLSATLQDVVDVFDRVWYGYQPLDEVTYQRYAAAVDRLKRYG